MFKEEGQNARTAGQASTYLLILGDQDGLAWVLKNRQMAFTENRAVEVSALKPGSRLFLYTTRGCYHNPTRDQGRVIGEAALRTSPARPRSPVVIGSRVFTHTCGLELRSLSPFREGVGLAELVPQLTVFPDKQSWSARMRRPLLALPEQDAELIAERLASVIRAPADVIDDYLQWVARFA